MRNTEARSEIESLEQSLQKSAETLTQSENESKSLRSKIELLAEEHKKALAAAARDATENATRDCVTREDHEKLILDLKASHSQWVAEETKKWEAKVEDALKEAVEEKKNTVRSMSEQLEAKHASEVGSLQARIKYLDSKIAEMQDSSKQSESVIEEQLSKVKAELVTSKTREEDFAKKGKALVSKLKLVTQQKTKLEDDAAISQARISELDRQVLEASTVSERLSTELDECKLQCAALEEKNIKAAADFETRVMAAESKVADTDMRNTEARSEIESLQTKLQKSETVRTELDTRILELRNVLEETRTKATLADKQAEFKYAGAQEENRVKSKKIISIEGELRLAKERIERLMMTGREKDADNQERVAALQRSLEEMRQQSASLSAEQNDFQSMKESLALREAALEDIKKTDKRIIADLKREMSSVLRRSQQHKEEQTTIAEKALIQLQQESEKVAELEDLISVVKKDLQLKNNEVEVAKMQIEQLSALAVTHTPSSAAPPSIMSWLTGAPPSTPNRAGQRY